jgi:hypothetical protein
MPEVALMIPRLVDREDANWLEACLCGTDWRIDGFTLVILCQLRA